MFHLEMAGMERMRLSHNSGKQVRRIELNYDLNTNCLTVI